MSRKDLLEILVEQSRRIDELTEEVAALADEIFGE